MNTLIMTARAPSSRRLRSVPKVTPGEDEADFTVRMERPSFEELDSLLAHAHSTRRHAVPPTPAEPSVLPMRERIPETPAEILESGIRPSPMAPKKPRAMALNKLVVSAYKLAGFAILTVILVGLGSYLAVNIFYFASSSWIVPTVLSPTDDNVLRLDALASQESAAKGAIVTKKLELESQLKDANRIVQVELAFQDGFRSAMSTDLADRKKELGRLQGLLGAYAAAKRSIEQSNQAYSDMSRSELGQQYDAHFIDKDQMLTGNYQLAQIAGANLSLEEHGVDVDVRVSQLQRAVDSLKNVTSSTGAGPQAQLSYDILHIKREYDQSVLASQKAEDDADALKKSIETLDGIIAEDDRLLDTIHHSPYEMAADKNLTIAFVPYDNRQNATVGTPVYACAASFVWCKKVGQVAEVIDGEVLGKHPLQNKDLRGVMVRLSLDDTTAIEKPVLHVGHKPLLI